MSDLPTRGTIIGKHPIEMLAAPSGITYLNTRNGPIDSEHLLQVGWKCVIVNCAPERNVTLQGVMGYQKQYAMRHIGLGTINKQTGNTSMDNVQLRCPRHAAHGQKNKLLSCLVVHALHLTQ